jgi:hypothetical protein
MHAHTRARAHATAHRRRRHQAQHQGVLIRAVEPTVPSGAALRQWDILMAFDGVAVACDGTVPFRSGERIGFSYLVSQVRCALWCVVCAAVCVFVCVHACARRVSVAGVRE